MNKNQEADKSPREFWVRPRRIGKGPTWNASENPSAYSGYNDSVHLIEHSAYLAVKQELETIKINLNYHVENYQVVCKELEAALFKLSYIEPANETNGRALNRVVKDRDELRNELDAARAEINSLAHSWQDCLNKLADAKAQIKDLTSALEDLLNYSYLHAGEKAKETLKKWKQK